MPGLSSVSTRESLHWELWPTWNSLTEVKQKTGQCQNEHLCFSLSLLLAFTHSAKFRNLESSLPEKKEKEEENDILKPYAYLKEKWWSTKLHILFAISFSDVCLESLLWSEHIATERIQAYFFSCLLPECLSVGSQCRVDRSKATSCWPLTASPSSREYLSLPGSHLENG